MLLIDTFVLALKNIWSNKMRTILTMLGIIIGVTAVIVIVGLGNGMTQQVRESFSSMGINSMSVSIWGRGSSRTATVDYMYQVVDDNPQYLSDISPNVQVSSQTVTGIPASTASMRTTPPWPTTPSPRAAACSTWT